MDKKSDWRKSLDTLVTNGDLDWYIVLERKDLVILLEIIIINIFIIIWNNN